MPTGIYQRKSTQGFQKGKGYWTGKKRPPFSKEWKEKISKNNARHNLGKKLSVITIQKISENRKGIPAWNKDIKVPQMTGEKHFAWLGDDVGYDALHKWVVRNLGTPDTCEECGRSGHQIHWANKDHEYKRNLEGWIRLCVKCHQLYDIKNNDYQFTR